MCAADGSNPSETFFREGDIAVACRRTAIAAGVAFFTTGFIITHFSNFSIALPIGVNDNNKHNPAAPSPVAKASVHQAP